MIGLDTATTTEFSLYWWIAALAGTVFIYKGSQYGMRPKGWPPGMQSRDFPLVWITC